MRQFAGARRTPESQESPGIIRFCAFCDANNSPARATSRNAEFARVYKSFSQNRPACAARQNHKNDKELQGSAAKARGDDLSGSGGNAFGTAIIIRVTRSQGIIRFSALCDASISPCAPRAENENYQGIISLFAKFGCRAPRARITRITRNYKGFRILRRQEFPCARHEPKCRICKELQIFLRKLAGARRTPESQE